MARSSTHRWAFKSGMRAGAFGWRSTAKAAARLKAAVREIKTVRKIDPVAAGEGVIALAERIWPAFEHIDTSSGSLGTAVARTLEDLVPILIDAPADETTRAAWAERLRTAIVDDGVDYLAPLADRFGEIAQVPSVINDHADRDLDLISAAWENHDHFSHVPTATLTLSCLLEAGRHDELLALVDSARTRLWFYEKYAAEALVRQGREAEALSHAAVLLEGQRVPPGSRDIARFCESLLIRQGKADDAYTRYGVPMTSGNTWLAMWRDLVKRYPDRDPRAVLEDLMAHHGRNGKWFATAKTAGYLDIAIDCAADDEASPDTLIRAARDFAQKDPAFAAQVALHAIVHLLSDRGFEVSPLDMDDAVAHLMTAARQIDHLSWALDQLRRIADDRGGEDLMLKRLRLVTARQAKEIGAGANS